MNTSAVVDFSLERLAESQARVVEIRERGRQRLESGATAIQTAAALSEGTDEFLLELLTHELDQLDPETQSAVKDNAALIAVGGSGRAELAPYSDADLLFLYNNSVSDPFLHCTGRMVQGCWDAKLKLGQSTRTLGDALGMAKRDTHFATSLTEARLLWGSESLFGELQTRFRSLVKKRNQIFVKEWIAGREEERAEHGEAVFQLEPDLKRSMGGLRDLHLIRWIGFARYGTTDIDSLRLRGALSNDEARRLREAYEFLLRLRMEMHFEADKSQDLFIREEQLRITESRNIEPHPGMRRVECFMQNYFRHSAALARICQQFVEQHQREAFKTRFQQFFTTHVADGKYKVGSERIDVIKTQRDSVCSSVESLMELYLAASLNGVQIAPKLAEHIKSVLPSVPHELSTRSKRLFLDLLKRPNQLGGHLRSMFDVGLLERFVPDVSRAYCLLQFNQYHSYTVDEHTFRAIEAVVSWEQDEGPLGTAYRKIKHKELLHLAVLLHDLGKGFEEDHSEVGARIADRISDRLALPQHQKEIVVLLVLKHLKMSHLAFRRNYMDPKLIIEFSHDVGTPETLRMLYALTAADLTAVGPGVWTGWKADVLAELLDHAMLILSGKHHKYQEEQRLGRIKEHVKAKFPPAGEFITHDWLEEQLDAFPPHYLTATSTDHIASDLTAIAHLKPDDILIDPEYDAETEILTLRVLAAQQFSAGCFHKITGALAALGLEILSAEISTTLDDLVVDRYRVVDDDFTGEIPEERIQQISKALRDVLQGTVTPDELMSRHTRFRSNADRVPVSNLPSRVVIDNDTTDYCTVIDVFAHDRPGLLYTITRKLWELNLSVTLARISTHFDQVVDVFYVTDANGEKLHDGELFQRIKTDLLHTIEELPVA